MEDGLHIDAAQGFVDGPRLHVRHGVDAHAFGDDVNDVGVNQAAVCQLAEFGDGPVLDGALVRHGLRRALEPWGTAMEGGD